MTNTKGLFHFSSHLLESIGFYGVNALCSLLLLLIYMQYINSVTMNMIMSLNLYHFRVFFRSFYKNNLLIMLGLSLAKIPYFILHLMLEKDFQIEVPWDI